MGFFTYSENIRGTILREHSWIAGLSAFTDMKEPEELQTSRATRNEPLSEGEAIMVSGEHKAEKRTSSSMSAHFFMIFFTTDFATQSTSSYNYQSLGYKC